MAIDYRELLKKYLAHVGEEEGITLVSRIGQSSIDFSEEEIDALEVIETERRDGR